MRSAGEQLIRSSETKLRRVRCFASRSRCNAMTLAEVIIAVAILLTLVWGAVAFITGGRVTTEKAGEQRKAAQVATEQLDRARHLPYASIASATGTETVDGLKYTWTLTVTTALADPADAGSSYKQAKVSVSWPTAGTSPVVLSTGISQ